MKIYTKTGDKGETGLVGGARVRKNDLRVCAYGDIDELNATLGMACVVAPTALLKSQLEQLQRLLFELGAEVATADSYRTKKSTHTTIAEAEKEAEADMTWLETTIDEIEPKLPPLKNFVLPGGSDCAARLHLARTTCRRAERTLLNLHDSITGNITGRIANTEMDSESLKSVQRSIIFINRLSDLLFMQARWANLLESHDEVLWFSRKTSG